VNKLPETPTKTDLYKYSRIKLRKKRSIKKFNKYWIRYISNDVYVEYMAKIMCAPIRRSLNYSEIGRKLIIIDELPQDAYANYQKDATK
jgi:hypothetical protein